MPCFLITTTSDNDDDNALLSQEEEGVLLGRLRLENERAEARAAREAFEAGVRQVCVCVCVCVRVCVCLCACVSVCGEAFTEQAERALEAGVRQARPARPAIAFAAPRPCPASRPRTVFYPPVPPGRRAL